MDQAVLANATLPVPEIPEPAAKRAGEGERHTRNEYTRAARENASKMQAGGVMEAAPKGGVTNEKSR